MKFIDLTHTFTDDMPVYPGDPRVRLEQVEFLEKGAENVHQLTINTHTGTHMDAPFHMIQHGKRIDEISPDKFFGEGILIDVRNKKKIDASILTGITIKKDAIVLLYSGFGIKYRTAAYFKGFPELKEDFAQEMVALGVKMVGMDTPGPDYDKPWTTHKILLRNGITILENLTNLDQLLGIEKFEIIALPAKLQADGAPVRVVAFVKD